MQGKVLDVKTGYDYTAAIPDISKNHYLNSIAPDAVFSAFLMPNDLSDGAALPTTSSHILCMVTELKAAKARFRHQGGRWQDCQLEAGCFGLGAAHDNGVEWQWSEENLHGDFNELVVHFSPRKMQEIAMEVFDIDGASIEIPHQKGNKDPLIEQLMLALSQEIYKGGELCALFKESFLQLLSVHLLSRHCAVKRQVRHEKGRLGTLTRKKIIAYIAENHAEQISLESLAKLANMSVYHFARLFKTTEGMSPRQYIIHYRLKTAQQLLRKTNSRIEQVAYATGFNSASHFNRMFKRHMGCSPVLYRRQIRK